MEQLKPVLSPARAPGLGRVTALHAVVLTCGVLCAFHPTLLSGGTRLQTDPGDTILNNYVLEHTWLWATRPGYVGTLWSPPCFYPAPLTLAYSENLLGTAPLYWLFRTGCTPLAAYIAWMVAVSALTYAATAGALRCFGVGHVFAAFGGFVFAFGLPRVVNVCHQQLLPHLFAPVAVCAAWRMVTRPRLRTLAVLVAACILQALSSIYLGWFLLLALALFLPLLLATHANHWADLAAFSSRSWLPAAALLAAGAVPFALLQHVYAEANGGFVREWEECISHMPCATDWLLPPPVAATSHWFGVACDSTNLERWCFPGWVVLTLALLGAVLAVGRPSLLGRERARVVLALLATALTLAIFSVTDPVGGSLWRVVYDNVPGAKAIRAVGRVGLTVLLFGLTGGLLALDALVRAPGPGRRLRWAVAGLVLLAGSLEQVVVELPGFDAVSFHARAQALSKMLRRGTAAYVVPQPEGQWYTGELLAMWAGLYGNQRVVNGYSGRSPNQFPDPPMPPDVVFGWLAANTPPGELWGGQLLYVAPDPGRHGDYRGVLLEATNHP